MCVFEERSFIKRKSSYISLRITHVVGDKLTSENEMFIKGLEL